MSDTPKPFNIAMIGAGGYIAPRHMKAIHDLGHRIVMCVDPNDSVGIIDRYFPDADFFTEFERFDRHAEKLHRGSPENALDYVTICSPNYLHDAHIRFALRIGAHAVCEKPLVLNPWNVELLREVEADSKGEVNTILQLRLHPAMQRLKAVIQAEGGGRRHSVDLTYVTARGKWYDFSWKGALEKSGGVATNIGIHFFDSLIWLFGGIEANTVHVRDLRRASGLLELENADIRWFLSINEDDLPEATRLGGGRMHRSLSLDGNEVDFTSGFENLHKESYQRIFDGEGYGLMEALPSIEAAHAIRNTTPVGLKGDYHPILKGLA